MRSPLVLLVEDEALIALALADDLEAAGYGVAGPFHRCRDTLDWLKQHTPDVAIIDIHLRDGVSAELAGALRDSGVPFIVFSGERRDGRVPAAFAEARWLSKPAPIGRLLETIEELLEGARKESRGEAGAPALAL